MRHLFCVENIDRYGSKWPLGTKMCNFDPKIGGQKLIFFCNCDFLKLRFLSTHKPRAATFPFGPPRKKISVSKLWIIFWASPLFLTVLGLSHLAITSTPNFGLMSATLGGTVRARPTEKWPILRSAENCYFWPKMHSYHTNTRKLLKDWCLFWKRILFCLHNFSRSWLEHGVQQEVVVFFGPRNLNFWPKTLIFAIRPQILSTSHF